MKKKDKRAEDKAGPHRRASIKRHLSNPWLLITHIQTTYSKKILRFKFVVSFLSPVLDNYPTLNLSIMR